MGTPVAGLDLFPNAAALFSPSGRLTEFNEAFLRDVTSVYGTAPRNGQFWNHIFRAGEVRSVLRKPGPEGELVLVDLGGESRRFHFRWQRLLSPSGRSAGTAVSIWEASPELTMEWHTSEPVVVSDALRSAVESVDGESLDQWLKHVHPEDRESTAESLKVGLLGHRPESWVFRLRAKDGGWKWFAANMRTVDWTEQGPVRFQLRLEDVTRIKRLERALSESEAQWQGAVSGAPVGISLLSASGTVLFSNGNCPPFLPPNSVGHQVRALHGDEIADELARVSAESLSSGTSRTLTHSVAVSDRLRRLEHHVGPVKGQLGDPSVVVFTFDNTERFRSQQHTVRELQLQEFLLGLHNSAVEDPPELFRQTLVAALAVFESSFGFVAQTGADGVLRVLCPHRSSSELAQGPWVAALAGTPVRTTKSWTAPEDLGGSEVQGALVVPLRREGTAGVFVIGERAEPYSEQDLRDLQTLVEGCWELVRRREAERANRLLLQTLESTPVSIVITDLEGTIEYVNPRFSLVMGFSSQEVLGEPISIIESGEVPVETMNELWAVIRGGRSWAGEMLNRSKDGRLVWESVSISPVFDSQGKMTHFVSAREDITQKKQTEEAISQARKMESVGQLAAGVAHDFNNLLASLLVMNDMLLLKLEAGDSRRLYAEKIALAGHRAADLVSSLLAFGRRQRLKSEALDLRLLLKEEAVLLESMLRGEVRFESALVGEPLVAEMDGGQISQVVMNLVSNARDAAGPGGTVWLSADRSTDGEWVCFSVRDNGPGIPEDLRGKIFEPFFTTKDIGRGTGLGLPVVSGIIAQHRGRIVLENPPEGGALFTVSLPSLSVSQEE